MALIISTILTKHKSGILHYTHTPEEYARAEYWNLYCPMNKAVWSYHPPGSAPAPVGSKSNEYITDLDVRKHLRLNCELKIPSILFVLERKTLKSYNSEEEQALVCALYLKNFETL